MIEEGAEIIRLTMGDPKHKPTVTVSLLKHLALWRGRITMNLIRWHAASGIARSERIGDWAVPVTQRVPKVEARPARIWLILKQSGVSDP